MSFRVIATKGTRMTFQNGITISVMFGRGNYCEHRWDGPDIGHDFDHSSSDAEVGIKAENGPWREIGYMTADEIAPLYVQARDLCHCGGYMDGSDHCDECGCEQHERTCEHRIEPQVFLGR